MPASKQLALETKRILAARKIDVVSEVTTAAFHIMHDSQMFGSSLWPKKGLVAGYGIQCEIKDRIYIGVNAYGLEKDPIQGRLMFNIHNTAFARHKKQQAQIRLIMDHAVYNNIYFKDEFSSGFVDNPWFHFTIQQ